MFLWTTPLGLKTFRNTAEKAEMTRVLAANYGLYNAFLQGDCSGPQQLRGLMSRSSS